MSYIVVYNKDKCTSAAKCMGIHPELWSEDADGKAILIDGKLNAASRRYERVIEDSELEAYKQSALICPSYVIDIVEPASKKSILNINPTKEDEKDKVPVIQASYDSNAEWRMDPKGFFTMKPFPEEGVIRVRYYGEDHALKVVVEGKNAEDIYNTIVREGFVSSLAHAAYVGSELMKVEIALKKRLAYVQDDPLPE